MPSDYSNFRVTFANGLIPKAELIHQLMQSRLPMHVSPSRRTEYFRLPTVNPKGSNTIALRQATDFFSTATARKTIGARPYEEVILRLRRKEYRFLTPAHVLHAVLYHQELFGRRRVIFILEEPISLLGLGSGGKPNITPSALVWNGFGTEEWLSLCPLTEKICLPGSERKETVARIDIYDRSEITPHLSDPSPLGCLSCVPLTCCFVADSWLATLK